MTVIAKRELDKTLPDGRYLVAVAQLEHLQGNARPHFSLTGEEWRNIAAYRRYKRTGSESGLLGMGAMGETLVEAFPEVPELALVERIHLSDDTGRPMHAEENGWYAYSGDWHAYEASASYHRERTDTPHELAASILRVSPEELPEGLDREGFAAFVESLAPRWQAEADRAREFLKNEGGV